jgi:glycosyltransferase involved in cell wall biosynthesis
MTPRVSVIMIVLDGERFIGEAIESVMAQHEIDWELLVVDDGSRDNTDAIVRSFASWVPDRIRLLHHPGRANRGMSASRNLGIAHASGVYLAFLDADDVFLPGKLAEQARILNADSETAMVYGKSLVWHSWQASQGKQDRFYELGVSTDETYPPGRLFRVLIEGKCQTPTTCNAMMRRDRLVEVGGFDNRFRGMFEDQIFFAKMLLRFRTHVSSRCWARYRQHDESTSAKIRDPIAIDAAHLRYLAAVYGLLRRSGDAPLTDFAAVFRKALYLAAKMAKRRAARAARRLVPWDRTSRALVS